MPSENTEVEVQYQANGEDIKLTPSMITQFLTSGNEQITQKEVVMFLNLCKYQHLNPFLKEAYIVKFRGKPAQIITGKEAFMKRANANPNYDGFKAGIIVQHGDDLKEIQGTVHLPSDKLIGGWCEVYRKDLAEPIKASVSVTEYDKHQSTWKVMPATMIRKTAMVSALREAFPETLGGMYTEDDRNPQEMVDDSKTPVEAPEGSVARDLIDSFNSENKKSKAGKQSRTVITNPENKEEAIDNVTESDESEEPTDEAQQTELLQPSH